MRDGNLPPSFKISVNPTSSDPEPFQVSTHKEAAGGKYMRRAFLLLLNMNHMRHKDVQNCDAFFSHSLFFTLTAPRVHVPQRQIIVSFTQDAVAHNGPFDGMRSGYKKKKRKAIHRGQELSKANSLNLTQTSKLAQQTWWGTATTTPLTCQWVYRHLRVGGGHLFYGWVTHYGGNHLAR